MKQVIKMAAIIFCSALAQRSCARTLTVTNMADLGKLGQVRIEQVEEQGKHKVLGALEGADEDYRYQTASWQVPTQPFTVRFEYMNKKQWPFGISDFKIEQGSEPIVLKIDAPQSVRRVK